MSQDDSEFVDGLIKAVRCVGGIKPEFDPQVNNFKAPQMALFAQRNQYAQTSITGADSVGTCGHMSTETFYCRSIILGLLFCCRALFGGEVKMEEKDNVTLSASEQLALSTVQIQVLGATNNLIATGTGFLFSFPGDHPNETKPVLFTNKHVPIGGSYAVVRFSTTKDGMARDGDFCCRTQGGIQDWIMHPDPSVDLCMLPIAPMLKSMERQHVKPLVRWFTKDIVVSAKRWRHFRQMDDVIMIGYPNGIFDVVNNQPIFRKGVLATNPSFDYLGKKEFLVDMAVYPGSSGSPILSVQEGAILNRETGSISINTGDGFLCHLLGVVSSVYNPDIAGTVELVPTSEQKQFTPIARTRIPNNLGLVIKADRILEMEALLSGK